MSLISTRGCQDISLELESPYDIQVFDDPEGREILSDYIALAGEDYTVRSSYLFDVYKDPGMHLQPIEAPGAFPRSLWKRMDTSSSRTAS